MTCLLYRFARSLDHLPGVNGVDEIFRAMLTHARQLPQRWPPSSRPSRYRAGLMAILAVPERSS
ncbi:MAG: hypothetical protein AAFR26_21780 [Cyanobacteria bacterium J06626_4]